MSPTAKPAAIAIVAAFFIFLGYLLSTDSYALLGGLATLGVFFLALSLLGQR